MEERDSLNRLIEQKNNEINDMMATFNDLEEGFRAINEAEQRVTLAKGGEGTSASERIRENMQYITERMQQNRELINKLRNQLRISSINGEACAIMQCPLVGCLSESRFIAVILLYPLPHVVALYYQWCTTKIGQASRQTVEEILHRRGEHGSGEGKA